MMNLLPYSLDNLRKLDKSKADAEAKKFVSTLHDWFYTPAGNLKVISAASLQAVSYPDNFCRDCVVSN